MQSNPRDIMRNAARNFLVESNPESLDEFDAVFDSAYDLLNSNNSIDLTTQNLLGGEPLSIDGSVVGQTIVSLTCIVAFVLVKAALKDSVRKDLPGILDKIEESLSTSTGKPKLVKAIRDRVEGIIQNI